MDGALVLVLIGWIISLISKKNKKKSDRRVSTVKKESFQKNIPPIAEKRFKKPEARVLLSEKEANLGVLQAVGEGESATANNRMEDAFRGSLQTDSTEGECICDPELEHVRAQLPEDGSVYSGEIGKEKMIDFSARGFVQGVVMSEILNRPIRHVRQR